MFKNYLHSINDKKQTALSIHWVICVENVLTLFTRDFYML